MASVSWTSTTGGDWSTGANWSGDAVPVASSEVTISTANSLTVTYSHDTSTIVSLETNVGDLFYMTGGALDVGLGIALGGGFAQSGGSLEVAGHNLSIDNLWQVGGTLDVRSGALALNGTNIIDGSVVAPELLLDGANTTIGGTVTAQIVFENNVNVEAGAVLAGSRLFADGHSASLNLSTGSTLSSALLDDSQTFLISAGAGDVTISGATSFLAGGGSNLVAISGNGTLLLSGVTKALCTIDLGGSETLVNSGTLTTSQAIDFSTTPYGGPATNPGLTNAKTGTWFIDGASASNIPPTSMIAEGSPSDGGSISNFGSMVVACSGTISTSFASTGHLSIRADDTLWLADATNNADTLGGTVSGAGTLGFTTGNVPSSADYTLTLAPGRSLGCGAFDLAGFDPTIALAGSASVTSAWRDDSTSSTYALNGYTLTLAGTTTFATTATSFGITTIKSGVLLLAGHSALGNGTSTGTLVSAATITNSGTFGGNGWVEGNFTNKGVVSVARGETLILGVPSSQVTIGGTLSGAGTIVLNGVTTIAASSVLSIGTLEVPGSITLKATQSITAGGIALDGGTLSVSGTGTWNTAVTSAGSFSPGEIMLKGGTLTLLHGASASGDENGVVSDVVGGNGTLILKGTSSFALGADGKLAISSGAELLNEGVLTVAGGGTGFAGQGLDDNGSIANTGTIELNSVTVATHGGGSVFDNSGQVSASGTTTFISNTTNTGTITAATGSALQFIGNVAGNGLIVAGNAATLSLSGADSGTVELGKGSTLILGNAAGSQFPDVISGFGVGDVIDLSYLEGSDAATATLGFNSTTGLLTITDGREIVTLQFTGNLSAGGFHLSDFDGGFGITYR